MDRTVNNILFKFLWDEKPDKIQRKIICSDRKFGGINFPNMLIYMASTKITWITRILNDNNLIQIVDWYFPGFLECKDIILNCNIKIQTLPILSKEMAYP